MKRSIHKALGLMLIIIFCFYPAGCSRQSEKAVQTGEISDTVNESPTASAAPSATITPTEAPIVTTVPTVTPTISTAPTVTPTVSTAPTVTPTVSTAPTAAPAVPTAAITAKPEEKPSVPADFVDKLDLSDEIQQLVCVIGKGGANCTVSFHLRGEDNHWTQEFSTDGECGVKGITYQKKEGDGKTPAGLYSFTTAFGIKDDPGAKLPYRKVTEYDYWIDDVKSPYYNTWINSLETPGEYTSEHLIDHSPQYNYALNINYNPDNTPGLGSAIFLHGFNGLGHTTGCIAVSQKYVKTLVQNLSESSMILIVPDSQGLKAYE